MYGFYNRFQAYSICLTICVIESQLITSLWDGSVFEDLYFFYKYELKGKSYNFFSASKSSLILTLETNNLLKLKHSMFPSC